MNAIINSCITVLNDIGRAFCNYSSGVFVQSGLLIVLLLLIDFMLRKRVRATFRYWMWMLVFIKLILPPTLSLPTGIGYWCGDFLFSDSSIFRQASITAQQESFKIPAIHDFPESSEVPAINGSMDSYGMTISQHSTESAQVPQISPSQAMVETTVPENPTLNPITWQAAVFLIWLIGVLVISVLLIQRILFVKGLIARSEPSDERLAGMLNQCRRQLGIGRYIELRLSSNISSPAVCGLFKPILLIPAALEDKLSTEKLRAVFIHELVHIQRGDLWINLVQTVLQIIYFYNPFVWLVNAVVRNTREQAVDEKVLVVLGAEVKSYSNTLIDVAEMAFLRTSLSLRLIGVVELKKALHRRIKIMLNRPVPESARLGIPGLVVIIVAGAILLPMAKAKNKDFSDGNLLIKFTEVLEKKPRKVSLDDITIWSKSYEVEFAQGEEMLAAVEVYQAGKPMQIIGRKIFEGSAEPEKLTVTLVRKYGDIDRTLINYSIKFQLGSEVFRIPEFPVHTDRYFNGTLYGWYQGQSMPALQVQQKDEHFIRNELIFQYCAKGEIKEAEDQARFWIPGSNLTPVMSNHCIVLRLMPLGGLKHLSVEPVGGYQGLDGTIMPSTNFDLEEADEIAADYKNMLGKYISQKQLNNDFKAKFPNGVTVELIGICEHPGEGKQWWRPDGGLLPQAPYESRAGQPIENTDEQTNRLVEFAISFVGKKLPYIDVCYKVPGATRTSGGDVQPTPEGTIKSIVCEISKSRDTAEVLLGVAAGQWKTITEYDGGRGGFVGQDDVVFSDPIETKRGTAIAVRGEWGSEGARRITAVDKNGKTHTGGWNGRSTGLKTLATTSFYNVKPEQIQKYQLQFRPYEWIEFKNVSLRPGHKTDVEF